MTTILPFLKELDLCLGAFGLRSAVRRLIEEAWAPLTDELSTSRLGSLHGLRRGSGPEPRPSILLAAHMDAIGLMVTGIVDGFLRFTEIGGVDPRVLPGQLVTVHGRQDLPGLIVQPPARLLPPERSAKAPVPLEYLLVDTGLLPEEVSSLVRVGDLVSFAQPPLETAGETLAGHSLDNRASVAAVTVCLEELQKPPACLGCVGGRHRPGRGDAGRRLHLGLSAAPHPGGGHRCDLCQRPGQPRPQDLPAGQRSYPGLGAQHPPGAVQEPSKSWPTGWKSPISWRSCRAIPAPMPIAMQVAAEGIPTMVVGIPLRYMHTPVEMVSLKDIHPRRALAG